MKLVQKTIRVSHGMGLINISNMLKKVREILKYYAYYVCHPEKLKALPKNHPRI